jgi:hypothetical protein
MLIAEVAKAVLYQCTVKNRDVREGEVEYDFNYKYLDDMSEYIMYVTRRFMNTERSNKKLVP